MLCYVQCVINFPDFHLGVSFVCYKSVVCLELNPSLGLEIYNQFENRATKQTNLINFIVSIRINFYYL